MKKHTTRVAAILAVAVAAAPLAACSAGDGQSSGTLTLTVGGLPTADKTEERANFERRVAEFEEANPGIDVQPSETAWDASTFQALVAGGQLPTVFNVPFTEMQGLIERQQAADISAQLADNEVLSSINPIVNAVAQSGDGVYGVPYAAYTMGLLYNRALFAQAGLDPDSPPANWDEVREAARAIEANTDAQGFASMTAGNTGGWVATTMSYSFGGTVVSEDGVEATADNPATRDVLEFYRDLRWQDDTFGDNFLLTYDDASNLFAGGRVGMLVQGSDAYQLMVTNKGMPAQDLGIAPLPQTPDGLGTLGGGTVAIVKPTASDDEKAASVQWIEFLHFEKYADEKVAVSEAEAADADGVPVGKPELPIVDAATYDRYLGWIEPYINVPRENFTAYLATVDTLPLVPEPAVKAQEIYAVLDTVVQAVLTREDADIDALLGDANSAIESAVAAG